jgi:1,2-diacylglycerol 3-alpha-glucosyltransferase
VVSPIWLGLGTGWVGKMRIGMMADVYKPHVSGVTNYISVNKRFLERLGHEVTVFSFGDLDYQDDEARVQRSPGLPLIDTGYYFSFQYSRPAKALLQQMDLVHVHHPFLSGRLALRYCRPLRIPIVFTNHTRYDLYLQTYLPFLADGIGETFLTAYLPSFCRAMDLVISPSQGMASVLGRLGVDAPITVIPNGVELGRFRKITRTVCREELGFSAADVILVYVGRLALEKNLTFLLRAFNGVVQAYPHARLLLIGEGPEREALMEQARAAGILDKVCFTGLIDYELLPGYLQVCDAFVTASVTEVHPLSIIEAMAAGLPVMGIVSPGVSDTIEDGVTGLLSNEDLAEFTAKMARMVTEGDFRGQLGAAARQAAEQYAIERTTQRMSACYEEIIERVSSQQRGIRFYLRRSMERWRK